MAEHRYAREYDQDFERSEDRERAWRDNDWDDRNHRERSLLFGNESRDYRPNLGDADYRHEGRRSFSNSPDDHYRSWRQKQIDALDRDYADYCREREEQFHNDFDSWRSRKHGNRQLLRTGMTQTGQSQDPTGELQLTNELSSASQNEPDAMGTATRGTTSGGRTRK